MINSLARLRVDILLLLVAVSWGSTYLVAKELVSPSSVIALLAVRMLLAAIVMLLAIAARRKRVTAEEIRAGVIVGILLAAVFAFETFGIAHTSATNAGLIISLTIVFTPVCEFLASGRRPPRLFFLAATIAVAGVALMASNGELRPPSLGDLLVLCAAMIRAVHVTSIHKLSNGKPLDSLALTAVQLATCAVLFTVASLFYGEPIPGYLAQWGQGELILFLYLVAICTVFAFFVQTWAVRRTSPTRVSLLLGTEPIWAAVVGLTLARDSFGPTGLLGIALVLVGTAAGLAIEQGVGGKGGDGGNLNRTTSEEKHAVHR